MFYVVKLKKIYKFQRNFGPIGKGAFTNYVYKRRGVGGQKN